MTRPRYPLACGSDVRLRRRLGCRSDGPVPRRRLYQSSTSNPVVDRLAVTRLDLSDLAADLDQQVVWDRHDYGRSVFESNGCLLQGLERCPRPPPGSRSTRRRRPFRRRPRRTRRRSSRAGRRSSSPRRTRDTTDIATAAGLGRDDSLCRVPISSSAHLNPGGAPAASFRGSGTRGNGGISLRPTRPRGIRLEPLSLAHPDLSSAMGKTTNTKRQDDRPAANEVRTTGRSFVFVGLSASRSSLRWTRSR